MADKNINIEVRVKNAASVGISAIKSAMTKLGHTIKTVAGLSIGLGRSLIRGFRNATYGLIALTAAGAGLVKTYMEQESASKMLYDALNLTGEATTDNVKKFNDLAVSLQKNTTIGDEAALSIIAYGKNLGVTTDQLEEATIAAVGLAKKLGVDVRTGMMLVARAAQGQTQLFTRYGIVLEESLTAQQKYNAILKIGAKSFKLAEDEAKTLQGRYIQLKNKVGDVFEEFGRGITLSLGLDTAFEKITNSLDGMLKRWEETGQIDSWAATIKKNVDSVVKVIEDLFAGGERREIAIANIKTMASSVGDHIAQRIAEKGPAIGEAIAMGIIKGTGKAAAGAVKGVVKGAQTQDIKLAAMQAGGAPITTMERLFPFFSNIISGGAFAGKIRTEQLLSEIRDEIKTLKQPEGS